MARGDQLARQWKILQILITSKMGKSVAEIASRLEENPRNIYRDLAALGKAGFPIYTERVEKKSLWSVLDTLKHQIPIPFNLMELMALYFGLDMIKVFKGTFFYDSLESLFQKIETTLPPESSRYLDNTRQTLNVEFKPYKDYGKFKEIINTVSDSSVNRKSIEIVYYTMSRRKETRRRVDPYNIWFFNGTFYLIGHCHLRGEVRIFALDRIKMLLKTNDEFEIPEDFKIEEFMRPSFGVFLGDTQKIKIWFAPEIAGYIKEKIWHESQVINTEKDGSLVFEADVAINAEIESWILSWGSGAEVLEPESLKNAITDEARRIASRYSMEVKDQEVDYR